MGYPFHNRRDKTENLFRILFNALLFVTTIGLSPNSLRANSQVTLRVGIYENSPKVILSEKGSPGGIFIEILKAIAKRERWELVFVPGTWKEGLERLTKGQIDIMPDVALDADRERSFSFHKEPALSSWSQIYARKGTSIKGLPDLVGHSVATLAGSVQDEQFTNMVKSFGFTIKVVAYPDFESAFRAVAEKKADAVVSNRYFGEMNAARLGLTDTGIIFYPTKLFFAATKGKHGEILEKIDAILSEFKANSASPYFVILRKYSQSDAPPGLPVWVWYIIWGAGIVALFFIGWSMALRRTAEKLRENDKIKENLLIDLSHARDSAESADRIKSAFLATMSHELRTPLNSIIGFSAMLLAGLPGPINAEQKKQLTMVRDSSEHLLALINDVLDISKIEAGQLTLHKEIFSVPSSLEQILQTIQPQALRKKLKISADISASVGTLQTDQRRFEQIMLNLLSNAVKFTENGEVHLTARRENGFLYVAVSDTGPGISQDDLTKLWKPFSQVDAGLSRSHEGTGLGLSICKRLVDLMGGSIWVESQLGMGSNFAFRIPLGGDEND